MSFKIEKNVYLPMLSQKAVLLEKAVSEMSVTKVGEAGDSIAFPAEIRITPRGGVTEDKRLYATEVLQCQSIAKKLGYKIASRGDWEAMEVRIWRVK